MPSSLRPTSGTAVKRNVRLELRIVELLRLEVGRIAALLELLEPVRHIGTGELGQPPPKDVFGAASETLCKRVVGVRHAAFAIDDDHQIGQGVDGVFELAPRAQHVLEEPEVFDRPRELQPEIFEPIEQFEVFAGLDPQASHHHRAERTAASAKREEHAGAAFPVFGRDQRGTCVAHRLGDATRLIVRRDALRHRDLGEVGRRDELDDARAPIVEPDRDAVRGKEALRAAAEDLQARREMKRRRDGAREFGDEAADFLADLGFALQPRPLERERDQFADGAGARPCLVAALEVVHAQREQAEPAVAHRHRNQHRRRRAQARSQFGIVGEDDRNAFGPGLLHRRAARGRGEPGLAGKLVNAVRRSRHELARLRIDPQHHALAGTRDVARVIVKRRPDVSAAILDHGSREPPQVFGVTHVFDCTVKVIHTSRTNC